MDINSHYENAKKLSQLRTAQAYESFFAGLSDEYIKSEEGQDLAKKVADLPRRAAIYFLFTLVREFLIEPHEFAVLLNCVGHSPNSGA